MTSERVRPSYANAEAWINPMLERAHKIKTVDENVASIREWVVDGIESTDRYGNTTYRRRLRKRYGNQRFTYVMHATSETDPESVDSLEKALSIGVVVASIPANGRKMLDVSFKYDDPTDPEKVSPFDFEPELKLYCHIFAQDMANDTVLETEFRRIPELLPHELDMVYELTSTVAGFIPPTPTRSQ